MRAALLLVLASCAFAQTPIVGINSLTAAGLPLTGVSFPAVRVSGAAQGDVDLYTAPTGKRVLVMSMGGVNIGGNSVTWYAELKTGGGAYYRLQSPTTTAAGALATSSAIAFVLEPGESISVNTTASGIALTVGAIQFDAANPLKSVRVLGVATGNTTMYTVPGGKTALALQATGLTWNVASAINVAAGATGGVYAWCMVASGGTATCPGNSPGEFGFQTVLSNVRSTSAVGSISMNAGDMIVINDSVGDTAQIAWINIIEF